jgi:hypothetical protein
MQKNDFQDLCEDFSTFGDGHEEYDVRETVFCSSSCSCRNSLTFPCLDLEYLMSSLLRNGTGPGSHKVSAQ